MDNYGTDDVKISGSDAAAECSETTIEIKIKTMFCYKTPTLRVDKCVPVPALKEEITMVTGVLSDKQRLIFSGKVLRDDKLLSDYPVKDGDTLQLIVTPIQALPAPETSPGSSSGHHQGNHSGANVCNGTSNLSEQTAQDISSITQMMNALLGNANRQSGNEELQPFEPETAIRMTHLGCRHCGTCYVPGDPNRAIIIRIGAHEQSSPREQTGSPGASNVGNSDHQTYGASTRVLHMRSMVSSLPASIGHAASDSARGPMADLATATHVSLGNSNNSKGSQASDQTSADVPMPNDAGQESIGLSGNSNSFSERTTPTIEERNGGEDRSKDGSAEDQENGLD